MINKSKLLIVLVLASAAGVFFSCGSNGVGFNFSEGIIEYDVTFPHNKDDILINIYPSEMILTFKDNKIHSTLQSLGGLVSTDFVVDNNTMQFSQYVRAFRDHYAMDLDEKGVQAMLSTVPKMILEPTEELDSLAGYLCKKTIAYFENDSVPPIILWHTSKIKIKSPNWYNQFSACDEMLLGYEVEQYGMRMKLTAKAVLSADVNDEIFKDREAYEKVDYNEMAGRINNLLTQFSSGDTPSN